MQNLDRSSAHGNPSFHGRNGHHDFSATDVPTFPPTEDDVEARSGRRAAPRTERSQRLGVRNEVYNEPAPDDWLLVAVGLGMSSSMLALLVMLFSGYGTL